MAFQHSPGTRLPMKFSPGGANELWPLVVPVIYLSIVTLPFGGSCSRKWGYQPCQFWPESNACWDDDEALFGSYWAS